MKKFLSRWTIAWLLSAVMTVSVVPVPVFAEDGQTANEPVIESELPVEETDSVAEETDSVTETEDSATDGTEPVVEGTEHVEEETEPVVEETEPVEEEIEPVAEEAPETVAPAEEESAVQKLQAEIDELPTLDEFKEMEPSEHEEFLEKANMLYEQACELSDEDYLALDLTKIEELLTYEGPAAELFALKPNQRLVSSEAELEYAIATAEGTREEPTEILLENDITLTSTLNIVDKFVTLAPFGTERVKITAASKFQVANARMIIVGDGTGEAYLGARKIDFVGSGNDENKYAILLSNANTDVELTNCKLTGGYSPDVTHGAGAMIYGDATFDGVEIYDNYGYRCGGLYTQAGANVHFMNGSIHDNAISLDYAGGVYVNGTGYIRIENSSIYGNSANSGSAIFSAGVVDLDNVSIYENKKCESIFVTNWGNDNTLTVNDCTFRDNENGDISPSAIKDLFVEGNTQMAISASLNDNLKVRGLGTDARIVVEHPAEISADSAYVLTETDLNAFEMKTEGYTLYLDTEANAIKSAAATTIIFHANNGTDTTATQAVPSGIATALNANTFTAPDGKVFAGWNTKADGSGQTYADGAEVTFSANTDLYAQWGTSHSGCTGCSAKNPHMITSAADLNAIRDHIIDIDGKQYINGYFKLDNDITFTNDDFAEGGAFYNDGKGWLPIGNNSCRFIGTFDGDGRKISNLTINDESGTYLGLFGFGKNAKITNLVLNNVQINGYFRIGTLLGCSESCIVSDIAVNNSTLIGRNHVGGVVGRVQGSAATEIIKCSVNESTFMSLSVADSWKNAGNVENINGNSVDNCTPFNTRVGGIVSTNVSADVNIDKCKVADTTVNGVGCSGGIISYSHGKKATITDSEVINSFIEAKQSTAAGIGAMTGSNGSMTADNCKVYGTITGSSNSTYPPIAFVNGNASNCIAYVNFIVNYDMNINSGYSNTIAVLNGGTLPVDTVLEAGKLATPEKAGFVFGGWYDNPDCSGTAVTDAVAGTTYYAKWAELNELRGFCGDKPDKSNVEWRLIENENGYTLVLEGEGALETFDKTNPVPWKTYLQNTTEVQIGEGITDINGAIAGSAVTELLLPASYSPENAKMVSWYLCGSTELTSIEVAEGNSKYTAVDGVLFTKDMTQLIQYPVSKEGDSYTIPETVSTVKGGSIYYCKNLKNLSLEKITTLEAYAVEGTPIESITIPKTLPLSNGMLFGLNKLKTVIFEEKPETIPEMFLQGCTSLSEFTVYNSVETIGPYAFLNDTALKNIIFEDNSKLTTIQTQAFADIGYDKAIIFPDSLQNVGSYAFSNSQLPAVYLPAALTTVEAYAFANTKDFYVANDSALNALKAQTTNYHKDAFFAVTNGGTFPADTTFEAGKLATPEKEGSAFGGWYEKDGEGNLTGNAVIIPVAGKTYYANWVSAENLSGNCGPKDGSGEFTKTATWAFDPETGTLTISGDGTTADLASDETKPWDSVYSDIIKVVVKDGVDRIGQRAFQYAPNLKELTLEGNVIAGDRSFHQVALETLNGQNYITKIEGRAFKYLNIETVDVSNATEIGEYGFEEASGLKSIKLGNNLKKIGNQAFLNAPITSLIIPDETEIHRLSFYSMPQLVALKLPNILPSDMKEQSFWGLPENCVVYFNEKTGADTVKQLFTDAGKNNLPLAVLNGGTFPADTVFEAGKLATPVKDGSIFNGWFTDVACTIPASETITAGETYYASWDEAKELTVTAEGYKGEYDGKFHSVKIIPSVEGAKILYSADNGKTYSDKAPQYKNSGEYVVYYKVQLAGCMDVTGSVLVIIDKIPNPVTITPSSEKVTGGKTVKFTVTVPDGVTINGITATLDGVACEEITVTKNNDGTFSAVMPTKTGTYTFMVDASGDKINNSENDATCTVTVKKKTTSDVGSGSGSNSGSGSSSGSISSSATKPVVGTAVSPVDETTKAEAAKTDANKAATKADNADNTLTLVSQNGTTVSGNDFSQPAVLSIPVSTKGVEDVNDLTIAKLDPENGKLEIVGGSYNAEAEAVVGYITEAGDYFVVNKDDLITIVLQIDSYPAKVNNVEKILDAAPILSQDRTMVPLRFVAETFGAKVEWLEATRTIVITVDGKVLTMTIGKELEGFGAAPVISDSRTMVPISYISTELGAKVVWVPSTKTVSIAK